MKYRSESKHGFTNSGCLHFATLKALHSFQVKRDQKKESLLFVIIMVSLLKVFKVGLSPSKKICFIFFGESPLKLMKKLFTWY